MKSEAYYRGMGAAAVIKELRSRRLSPRVTGKLVKAAVTKAERKAKHVEQPNEKRRYIVKLETGFSKGTPEYHTVCVSLDELKEGFRQHLTGNGSYSDTLRRVTQFHKDRKQ